MEPLSSDPKDKKFLSFSIVSADSGNELCRFKADNIVQMRRFMASLGTTGDGFFTKQMGGGEVPVEATQGKWDVIHPSEDELVLRQQQFEKHEKDASQTQGSTQSSDAPPSYSETIQQLPIGFYFPQESGISLPSDLITKVLFPGQNIPVYNATASLPKAYRRAWHDTFRPPYGPPTFFPVSIGYGPEVGLQAGQQALWDPVNKTYFFLDHFQQITFYEDPRPAPAPKPTVTHQQQVYGDCHHETSLPPNVCGDSQIVRYAAQRARSKPHGCTVVACGRNGQNGMSGQTGQHGSNGFHGSSGLSGSNGSRGGDGTAGGPGTHGQRGVNATDASDVFVRVEGDANGLQVTGTTSFVAQLGGEQVEEVMFINCRGGDGGHGGRGGDGGHGGSGGSGGSGGRGRDGHSSMSGRGGDGGSGGNGGNGGNGGPGGPGGKGW